MRFSSQPLSEALTEALRTFTEFETDKDVTERNVMLHAEYDRLHSSLCIVIG